ncbi:MAG: hypothetical protein FH748_14055 [Balneolaceae bacterium]|nr:hypothetical protein [Balneolaceae bacterium]
MKLITVSVIFWTFFSVWGINVEIPHPSQKKAEGSITGTVVLSPKNAAVRFGGGLYGRPAPSSGAQTSNDSVLVVLMSSQPVSASPQTEPIMLDQKDQRFSPNLLPIRRQQVVRFRNSDPVYHNVFSLSDTKKFDVGRRPMGEHLDVTFDKSGLVDVFCDIHSNMHAVIYVMPDRALSWTKIQSGASFNFEQLSPGSYELKIHARGYDEVSMSVEVSSDEQANVGTITLNS